MMPILLAFVLPFLGPDPSPSLTRSTERARRLQCVPAGEEALKAERPGVLQDNRPRGDFVDRRFMVCREHLLRLDLRHPRDDAILADLTETIDGLVTAATAIRPDLADRTWLVESFYPNPQVDPKIRLASQIVLLREGLSVSDRRPTLSAGDLDVILRLPPADAYPTACARYTRSGSLGEGDALLAIVHRDPQETALHAAVCADGRWMWIR